MIISQRQLPIKQINRRTVSYNTLKISDFITLESISNDYEIQKNLCQNATETVTRRNAKILADLVYKSGVKLIITNPLCHERYISALRFIQILPPDRKERGKSRQDGRFGSPRSFTCKFRGLSTNTNRPWLEEG